jgi:mannose-6-phosphate isomerase
MTLLTEPLLLRPHLAERPWGGTALGDGIGEAWDLSVHPNGPSVVAAGLHEGRTLAEVVDASPDSFGGPIELLAKRLDCAQNLSVQVHPETGDPKTEAWAVLAATKPGAGVFHGVNRVVERDELRASAEDGSMPDLLRFVELDPGQGVFVPAGTIHAIGGGLQLFELQQSSDTTYRLYDWGRDREMHLEQGIACSRVVPSEPVGPAGAGSRRLISCEFFTIDWCEPTGSLTVDPGEQWSAVTVVAGSVTFDAFTLGPGQTAIVPQSAGIQTLSTGSADQIVLVYGPNRAAEAGTDVVRMT